MLLQVQAEMLKSPENVAHLQAANQEIPSLDDVWEALLIAPVSEAQRRVGTRSLSERSDCWK
jgi:hypothetical protein